MLRRRAWWVLAVVALSGVGCATTTEPLWYKPGRDYTTAEFNRDRDVCTKGKKFDQECMKAKGWVPVSPDRPTPAATPSPQPGRGY